MLTLIWGQTFLKAYKRSLKKHPGLLPDIEKVLRILSADPFAPQLETHKLKGKLSGSWACSIGRNLRIIFNFVKNEKGPDDSILLIEIGNHDEVY
jgi:addiction module RelE/StbE family toxin